MDVCSGTCILLASEHFWLGLMDSFTRFDYVLFHIFCGQVVISQCDVLKPSLNIPFVISLQ